MLKSITGLIAVTLVFPLVVGYRLASLVLTAEKAFPGFSQFARLLPCMTGAYLRQAFYRYVFPSCSEDCWISFGTIFFHCSANVGRRTHVGIRCMLGDVTLEDDVLLGSHVSIINGNTASSVWISRFASSRGSFHA